MHLPVMVHLAILQCVVVAVKYRNRPPTAPHFQPTGNVFQAPPPAYGLVCGDPNYGWLPYSTFPSAPPGKCQSFDLQFLYVNFVASFREIFGYGVSIN